MQKDWRHVARYATHVPGNQVIRALQALYESGPGMRIGGTPPRVAVVGGGLAGLVASHVLTLGGCEPMLFEASMRIGGRVRTDHGRLADHLAIDLGGEFIDSRHADMLALARAFECALIDVGSRSERLLRTAYRFGRASYTEAQAATAFAPHARRIAADAARLSRAFGRKRHSELDARFDRLSIDEYLDRLHLDAWLRALITAAYTTLNGRDCGEQSCLNLLQRIGTDTSEGFAIFGQSDERWKVAQGMDRITDGLAGLLKQPPRLGHRLVRLSRAGAGYALDFETPGRTVHVLADVVVLALPFTLLRQVEAPGIYSQPKRRAIEELAYGANSKLLVATRRRLWREYGCSGALYTDGWAQCGWDGSLSKGGQAGVYTFFLGGRTAVAIGAGTARQQAERLSNEAEAVWPGFRQALTGRVERVHWSSEPWALGSYATYAPGQRTAFGGDEGRPEGALYFAGEHCSARWQGYLEGAASTGRKAALDILRRAAARS